MDWLRKHWKGALGWTGITVVAAIIGKIVDLYFDVSILTALGRLLTNWYITAISWLSSEIPIPIWLVLLSMILLTILVVGSIVFLCRYLKPASDSTSLPSDQHSVLYAIGICNHVHSYNPTVKELAESCEHSVPIIERATEALHQSGLIKWKAVIIPRRFEAPQVLHGALITSKGRDYLLDAGIDPSNPSPGQGKI